MRPSRPQGIGRQSGIPEGLPDEEFRSGWANVQSNNYWSSSTNANNTNNAWIVNMRNGNVNNNNKTNNNYVWPVRSGEWGSLFSFENLYKSYLKCRIGKRGTSNALKFEINAEENLFELSDELCCRTYQPSRSICFIVEKPKMREIIAADFRDRVVHHLLVNSLEQIYEPVFIYDSHACRVDKGLHKAVERVRSFIRKGSANSRKKLYFLHLDIRNFFMTIDREMLFNMLEKKLMQCNRKLHTQNSHASFPQSLSGNPEKEMLDDLLWLARTIIFHNPVDNCIVKGNKHLIKHLPPHKSLFHAPANKGLPIGNLTSQFFANVYLNELDQYVKHTLKCRYYARYCDDFIIIDESPERLAGIKESIEGFLSNRLALSLNDKFKGVTPLSNGIDFLGYIIKQDYTLVRRRTVNNLRMKLDRFEKELNPHLEKRGKGGSDNSVQIVRYDYTLLARLRSVLASYTGHLKWGDTYSLRQSIAARYPFLKEFFQDGNITEPLFRHSWRFPSVINQYRYFATFYEEAAVFFQVGCFYEFYSEARAAVILGLKRIARNRRGVRYGFHVKLEGRNIRRILQRGMSVVIVRETGRYIDRIKERLPVMKIIYQCQRNRQVYRQD